MTLVPPTGSRTARDDLFFVGTATTLITVGGLTVLTDPNFLHQGQRAYLGKGLWSRRRTEPALAVDELPPVDVVVLSHLHGDHFDRVARHGLDKAVPVVTTTSAAPRLRRWGFAGAVGLDTWQVATVAAGDVTLRITAMPGIHAHGPMQALLPPVMGSLLEFFVGGDGSGRTDGEPVLRLYLTGDTLLGEHIAEVARRHPDIDVGVLHLGGTKILGVTVTMDARQGADLLEQVRPGMAVPVHYDDYPVFRSPLSDFLAETERRGLRSMVRPVRQGESIALPVRRTGARRAPAAAPTRRPAVVQAPTQPSPAAVARPASPVVLLLLATLAVAAAWRIARQRAARRDDTLTWRHATRADRTGMASEGLGS